MAMGKPIGIRAGSLATAALGALFVVCWSSGFVGAKLGAAEAPVPTVLLWRTLPLALALAPALLLGRTRPTGRDLGRHVVVGALSQSGYLLTVYWAIGLGVSTGTTALIDGLQPLVVAALAGPLLGVAVTGRQWAGLGMGLTGVALVCLVDATAPGAGAPPWAYAVPPAGMLCLVAATFLERRAPTRAPALQTLAVHCATSAVVFTAVAVVAGEVVPPASARFWVAIVWLVVLATFGGYGLYWFLLRRVGVTRVNALMFLVPPVTTLWGAALLGEPLTLLTAAGLALATTATWLVTARVDLGPGRGRRDSGPSASDLGTFGPQPATRSAATLEGRPEGPAHHRGKVPRTRSTSHAS